MKKLIIVFCLFVAACSNKHISKTQTDASLSRQTELEDSVRLLVNTVEMLQSTIRQLQFGTVEFDSSKCPPPIINVPANCNVDSIRHLIESFYQDQIKVFANGDIEVRGKLRNLNFTLQRLIEEKKTLQKALDSTAASKQKERVDIQYQEKIVEKKISRIPWWLVAAAILFLLLYIRKQFFPNYLKFLK